MQEKLNLRDLCDTLCVTLYSVGEFRGDICIPFYAYPRDIMREYHARKIGTRSIPCMEHFMAIAINDCIERQDANSLGCLLAQWQPLVATMTRPQQELFIEAWLSILPRLQAYERLQNPSAQRSPRVGR